MKHRIFKLIMVFLVFGVVISLTYTFAWYTYTTKIGKIDAETKDIAFAYRFDESEYINETSYSITNLTFFDIDDTSELKYLNDMHTVIQLDIDNYSSDIIDYTIDFSSNFTEIKDGDTVISRAYVVGFITTIETIALDEEKTVIKDYIPLCSETQSYKSEHTGHLAIPDGSNADSSVTLYLHLIGVQEIDTANNDFLFNNDGTTVEYKFTLTIKAVGRTKDPEVNTTPSTTSTGIVSTTTATAIE